MCVLEKAIDFTRIFRKKNSYNNRIHHVDGDFRPFVSAKSEPLSKVSEVPVGRVVCDTLSIYSPSENLWEIRDSRFGLNGFTAGEEEKGARQDFPNSPKNLKKLRSSSPPGCFSLRTVTPKRVSAIVFCIVWSRIGSVITTDDCVDDEAKKRYT